MSKRNTLESVLAEEDIDFLVPLKDNELFLYKVFVRRNHIKSDKTKYYKIEGNVFWDNYKSSWHPQQGKILEFRLVSKKDIGAFLNSTPLGRPWTDGDILTKQWYELSMRL